MSGLWLAAVALFLVRGWMGWGALFWEQWVALAVFGLCFGLLSGPWPYSGPLLRLFELAIFGTACIHLLYINHLVAEGLLQTGDQNIVAVSIYRVALGFFALMVIYGMFIPSNWRRTLIAVSAMMAAPLALAAYYWATAPSGGLWPSATDVSFAGITLLLGGSMAVVGSNVIHTARQNLAEVQIMGTYELEERIGSGGMGEVWKARHRLLARSAALKMIRPEVVNSLRRIQQETLVQRFKKEAQATATLRSPHTVELYDFGVTNNGNFYYVMEYLDGLDLDTLVQRYGPVRPARAVWLLQQAGNSLAEAHQAGIMHRDIKPSNIFVCRLGVDYDFVKVLDFGLAKWISDGDADQDGKLTQEGVTTGTPAFMAPELALAKKGVDARADIYALGCVAYWLLTGNLVFEANSPLELVVEHATSAPVAPSKRSEMPISASLDRLVLACLEKDPEKRPPNLGAFLQALSECEVDASWTPQEAANWWRLHLPPQAA